jgi:hypothetical protein
MTDYLASSDSPANAICAPHFSARSTSADSSIRSAQSFSFSPSVSVASLGRSPLRHRQNLRSKPYDRNRTWLQTHRLHLVCAEVPGEKCYSSFRCTACRSCCTRCKRNFGVPSCSLTQPCHPERSWRSRSECQRSRRTPRNLTLTVLPQGILSVPLWPKCLSAPRGTRR